MADKKSNSFEYSISGVFNSKAAEKLEDELISKFDGDSLKGAVLDFSAATHITTGGIAALRRIGDTVRKDGKELTAPGMKSEMYKALKVAGASDAISLAHRSV